MYKACIFDLDGTLVDTLDSLLYSVNKTMEAMQLRQITKEQCKRFVGNGSKYLLERTLEVSGDPNKERLAEALQKYEHIFQTGCTYQVVPYPGILEMVQTLQGAGMRLAVLSNKPDLQAKHVVETIFPERSFDCVHGQKEGIPRKPDPTAACMIAQTFQMSPEEILYIGDSEVDVATGKAAHMPTIAVSWGFRDKECLEAAGAVCILDEPQEIIKLACKEQDDEV